MGGLADQAYSARSVRFITIAPIVAAVGIVVVQLALTWSYTASAPRTLIAVALVAGYLPCHLHHLWAAAHARRPRAAGATLAVMALIIAAGTPLVGFAWLMTWVQLLVSVLIVLPRPWSWLTGLALVAAAGPMNLLLHGNQPLVWAVLVLLERSGAILVPAWFAGALHQLRAARADLAADAVLRERARIDGDLAHTVGVSLDDIAVRGTRTGALVGHDRAATERELRALVDVSRRSLAAARRIIREYQRVSLRAELDSAVALLTAAGIHTSLTLPRDLPESAGREITAALRSAVDRLLHDDMAQRCEISVARTAGRLRLALDADGTRLADAEATA